MTGRVVGVLLAGGAGARFGAPVGKTYVPLGGRPLIAHPLASLDAHPAVDDVVVVVRAGAEPAWAEVAAAAPTGKVRAVVPGGATRQGSEEAALAAVDAACPGAAVLLLHDAARPFLAHDVVDALLAAVRGGAGAIPAHPIAGALHDVGGRPVPTADLVAVQTPQAFPAAVLRRAYAAARAAGFDGVDTAQTVQAFDDGPIRWVPADPRGIKVTHPGDLARATALLGEWGGTGWLAPA